MQGESGKQFAKITNYESKKAAILLDMEMGTADSGSVEWLDDYEKQLVEEKYFENIR